MMSADLAGSALDYLTKGWSVIPLSSQDKIPLIPWKEYQQRHAGADEIETWWASSPEANLGLVTGKLSKVIVLDVDGEAGQKSLKKSELHVPVTATAKTGKGYHHYFRHPGGVCQSFSGRIQGLDLRGDGGYVVLPPSVHPSGERYRWEIPPEDGVAEAPDWLLGLIQADNVQTPSIDWASPIPEGKRNSALTRRCGQLLRLMPAGQVFTFMRAWNNRHCIPPLKEKEVRTIVKSIASKEAQKKQVESSVASHNEDVEDDPSQRHIPMNAPVMMNDDGHTSLPFIKLSDIEPKQTQFTIEGILPTGHISLMFGDGGQGKSYLALYLATCISSGKNFLGKDTSEGKVIYVDFELSDQEQAGRARKMANGLGLESPPDRLLYLAPGLQEEVPTHLEDLIGLLREEVKTNSIELIIFDSLGAAIQGDPESARDVCRLFHTLRGLGTVLLIDHQAKMVRGDNYSEKTPFGSVYKQNLARSVFQLKATSNAPGEIRCLLYHKKSNFTSLKDHIGLSLTFKPDTFTVEEVTVGEEFTEHLPVKDRVFATFRTLGEATAAQVAEASDVNNVGSVRNAITTLKARGQVEDTGRKRDKATIYSLVDHSSSQTHLYGNDGDDERLPERSCSNCGQGAGTLDEPLFGLPNEQLLCRSCHAELPKTQLED